ncbi:MAG TPA: hypothetical protein VF927_07370 [Solirubrobacteraceae bacterium]
MTGLTRLRALGPVALVAMLVALALPAVGLAAAAKPTYTKESKQAYEAQLSKGEIAAAVFNKPVRSLRLTLKNGRHFLYTYPAKGSQLLEEQLVAKGVPVSKLGGSGKKQHNKATSKHTRRYIAIGILVLLLLVGGGVLLARRRRLTRD